MTLQHLTHRRFVRRTIAGTVHVRQGDHLGTWSARNVSERGLCAEGDLEGFDLSKPVALFVKVGMRMVDVTAELCWSRQQDDSTVHGWTLTEVPGGFARLVG